MEIPESIKQKIKKILIELFEYNKKNLLDEKEFLTFRDGEQFANYFIAHIDDLFTVLENICAEDNYFQTFIIGNQ